MRLHKKVSPVIALELAVDNLDVIKTIDINSFRFIVRKDGVFNRNGPNAFRRVEMGL